MIMSYIAKSELFDKTWREIDKIIDTGLIVTQCPILVNFMYDLNLVEASEIGNMFRRFDDL